MRKRIYGVISFFILFLFLSCNSTSPFVSDVTTSKDISIQEKLSYYGGKEVFVDEPEMFFDGEEWLERLEKEVEKADDYIVMSLYLGSSSPVLENLFSIMERKAEEGVRIYLIVDGSSNMDMTDTKYVMTPLNYLRESGINLLIYAPLSFSHIANPSQLLVRDHRKLIVIDGKVAVVGGMNLNYISIGAGEKNQRDSMYLFYSPSLATLLLEEFISSWNRGSVDQISMDSFNTYHGEGSYRAWLFNRDIYKNNVSISGMYGSLMEEAEESVFLCPFLPCADDNMKKAIERAVDRGVDYEIWCSQDPREYLKAGMAWSMADIVTSTGASFFDVTKDEGGEDYPLFHMKMMVVDDRWLVVGSSNYNFRSMALSHELVLVIDSPSVASKAKERAKESGGNPIYLEEEELLERKDEYGSFLGYLMVFFGG